MKFALILIFVANFGFLMSMAQKDTTMALHPDCPTKVCPRIYRPVCCSVDGVLVTEPNICKYQTRKNCARMFCEQGRKFPVVCLEYRSACKRPQQQKNKKQKDRQLER